MGHKVGRWGDTRSIVRVEEHGCTRLAHTAPKCREPRVYPNPRHRFKQIQARMSRTASVLPQPLARPRRTAPVIVAGPRPGGGPVAQAVGCAQGKAPLERPQDAACGGGPVAHLHGRKRPFFPAPATAGREGRWDAVWLHGAPARVARPAGRGYTGTKREIDILLISW